MIIFIKIMSGLQVHIHSKYRGNYSSFHTGGAGHILILRDQLNFSLQTDVAMKQIAPYQTC